MASIVERKLNALKPRARLYEEKYKGGLFVQVRSSGSKSWIFRYSRPLDSKQVRMTIGKYSDFTFDEIEEIAFSYRKLVKKGICPKQAKAAEVSHNKQVVTCDYLFEAWIGHSQLSQDVTVKWVKRHKDRWRLHLKKPLKDILAKDVTRGHLAALLYCFRHLPDR
jgi:Arm domain-containing DNA-binding protein